MLSLKNILGLKKFWAKKKCWVQKMFGLKKFESKTILALKIFWSIKNLSSTEYGSNLGKKNLGSKKMCVQVWSSITLDKCCLVKCPQYR